MRVGWITRVSAPGWPLPACSAVMTRVNASQQHMDWLGCDGGGNPLHCAPVRCTETAAWGWMILFISVVGIARRSSHDLLYLQHEKCWCEGSPRPVDAPDAVKQLEPTVRLAFVSSSSVMADVGSHRCTTATDAMRGPAHLRVLSGLLNVANRTVVRCKVLVEARCLAAYPSQMLMELGLLSVSALHRLSGPSATQAPLCLSHRAQGTHHASSGVIARSATHRCKV